MDTDAEPEPLVPDALTSTEIVIESEREGDPVELRVSVSSGDKVRDAEESAVAEGDTEILFRDGEGMTVREGDIRKLTEVVTVSLCVASFVTVIVAECVGGTLRVRLTVIFDSESDAVNVTSTVLICVRDSVGTFFFDNVFDTSALIVCVGDTLARRVTEGGLVNVSVMVIVGSLVKSGVGKLAERDIDLMV